MHKCIKYPPTQLIVGIIVPALFIGESLAQENTDWKDRLFAEAPKRWEGYQRFARSLQITTMSHRYKGADRSLERSVRTEYKQTKGASLRIVYRKIGPRSEEAEAEGINPAYSFNLKRRSPDRGWIITDLELPDQSASSNDEQRKPQAEKYRRNVCDCLILENLWLSMLIQDADFKITATKPQEIEGHPVVRFDFDYPKPDKDYPHQGGLPIKGGWMVLDPEHDWILREYMVHTGQPEEHYMHQTFQIREGTDRHPIVTYHVYRRVGKGKNRKPFQLLVEVQWQAVEQSNVPLEEFTLTAFGLPEPPGIQVGKSRLHLWIALAGIVCLGIAALIRWQFRRTRTAG